MNLVTGARSGLGRFLQSRLDAVGFTRQDKVDVLRANLNDPYSAIIHCAFNVNRGITSHTLSDYLSDNMLLAQQLLALPHEKFIFISTSDVYPREYRAWCEDDEYSIDKVEGLYGLTKLMVENIIKQKTDNYLILRPTALLGKDARPNSLYKVLNETNPSLTLHSESSFNYILHEDVLRFIEYAIANDLRGVFNLAASSNVLLGDVAIKYQKEVHFGSYVYQVAHVDNSKVTQHCPVFNNSSMENIERFRSI